jgi:hypothetical protein
MPRPDLTMSRSAVQELLATCRTAAVAVPGPDGFPLASLGLVSLDAGELVLELAEDDPVAGILGGGSAACVVVDTWPSYDQIQGLIVRGHSAPRDADRVDLEVRRVTSFDFSRAGG